MNHYLDSLKSYISDKASSPFLPALTISWCVVNFPVFLYVFSGIEPSEKIKGIEAVLASGFLNGHLRAYLLPLALALFYVTVYPWFARLIMVHVEKANSKTKSVLLPIKEESPRSAEEFKNLEENFKSRIRSVMEEFAYQESQAAHYKKISQESESALRDKLREFSELASENVELASENLELASANEDRVRENEALTNANKELAKAKAELESENAELLKQVAASKQRENKATSTLQYVIQKNTGSIRELEASLELEKQQYNNLLSELSHKNSLIEKLRSDLNTNNNKVNAYRSTIEDFRKRYPELRIDFPEETSAMMGSPIIRKGRGGPDSWKID